jgi:lipopolysaccharide/colanic/teichoic acid biosynthesis glycosyltransferase
VCIGDLALVGVKPLRPTEVDLVQAEWYQKRFECPAGFTGLWYIQTDPSSDLEEIVIADTFFAATRTWRSEIGILLRTPVAWLRRGRSSRRREPGLATIADVEQSHKQHAL